MKVRAAHLTPVAVPLRAPLVTAHARIRTREGFLLELSAFSGARGFGEALPLAGFGLESAASAGTALTAAVRKLVGREIDSPAAGLSAAASELARAPAARAALDSALRDLGAREAGEPLAAHLATALGSGVRARVPTGVLLAAEHPDDAAEEARGAVAAGFRVLKLKLGAGGFEADRARLAAVREAVGAAVALRVDANGAWSEAAAAAHLDALAALGVEFVEQPLPGGALDGLARLRRTSPVPLAADESVRDVASAERLLRAGAADVLVVKPAAVGGLGAALSIARRARDAQVEVLVTSFLDTAIGRAGALHLAAALPHARHAAGLATGGLLADDLARGPAPESGAIALPRDPGLGCEPEPAALVRLASGASFEVTA